MSAWLIRFGCVAGLAAIGWSVWLFGLNNWRLVAFYIIMLGALWLPLAVERRYPNRFQPNFQWYLVSATFLLLGVLIAIFTIGLYFVPAAVLYIVATIRLTYERVP